MAQKDRWVKEYQELNNLPSSRTAKPSRALRKFIETGILRSGRVLDVGSGKGRNSIYLAENGFSVVGVEMVEVAIAFAEKAVEEHRFSDKVRFINQSIGERIPFSDDSFDLIIDMMTMHLLSRDEREIYQNEVVRLLKPGGYFVFYTIAAEGPAAQELFRTSPGPEENSYVIPQTGMIEKAFTRNELEIMFTPLVVVHLEKKTEFTPAFGDIYEREYYTGVMKRGE